MIILPALKFLFSGGYVTYIFLLAFSFGILKGVTSL